jgi:hypothetical protein
MVSNCKVGTCAIMWEVCCKDERCPRHSSPPAFLEGHLYLGPHLKSKV